MMTSASERKLTDCPSNLKEAIDWILRVTGKDGGGDNQATQILAEEVSSLLNEVIKDSPGFSLSVREAAAVQKLREWLNGQGTTGYQGIQSLIKAVADGLGTFIGYEAKQNNGLIGVDGIAVSNDPLERLRDAVLGFWIGALGQVVHLLKTNEIERKRVNGIITKLQAAVGVGKEGVKDVVSEIDGLKRSITISVDGVKEILGALQTSIHELNVALNSEDLNRLAKQVTAYVQKVTQKVAIDADLSNVTFQARVQQGNAQASGQGTSQRVKPETFSAKAITQVQSLTSSLNTLVLKVESLKDKPIDLTVNKPNGMDINIRNVKNGPLTTLSQAISSISQKPGKALVSAVISGTHEFLKQLQKPSYVSYYRGLNWLQQDDNNTRICAKILLGCIPLLFNHLSYLCWRCGQSDWKTLDLGAGALSAFMFSMSFSPNRLNGNVTGNHVVSSAFGAFKEFQNVTSFNNYAKFFKTIDTIPTNFTDIQNIPLSALYFCASVYFKCCQSKNAAQTRRPSSIRDILYWLASLQFSPHYYSLETHITTIIPTDGLQVAISGSRKSNEKLAVDQIQDYLVITCIFCPVTLGWIQKSENGSTDPFLHELFSNGMCLKYQSGAALFNDISNYSYALQFQLSFLYQQCKSNYTHGCGWQDCRYGADVHPQSSGARVLSNICSGYTCNGNAYCRHDGQHTSRCSHHKSSSTSCGMSGLGSPLQAFLTDKLQGFSLPQIPVPDSLHHFDNHSPSYMCHIPMGFASKLRKGSGMGGHLYYALLLLCGNSKTPLRQLSEKLGCLTKRTPRAMGDLFGFLWHLNSQLFKTRPTPQTLADKIMAYLKSPAQTANNPTNSSVVSVIYEKFQEIRSESKSQPGLTLSLLALYNDLPFWFQVFMVDSRHFLPLTLFDLKQHCHKYGATGLTHDDSCSGVPNSHADLFSLQNTQCSGPNCGPFLSPLCHSNGATYNPAHASAYLSWVLYLVDDLQKLFHDMIDDFNNTQCTRSRRPHGADSTNCSCRSVVQCDGVLPLLYRHGFYYHNTEALNGWAYHANKAIWMPDGNINKDCTKFHSALSNVLAENAPLHNLLLAIDEFLYYVRFRFMSMVSSFWLCSLLILLYFVVYGIDVLHVKSHVHLPSSHILPPIGLLTTGKAPALTKLPYYMP
ncbi:variant erythrocyte surface antigen-1 family protein [Babesia caballi]|uniref:Variant erythrocyte surface antigen-1 family protein n=1 Tax=Babesia caballi TaxID=5871 RepID=A0AAV4LNL0_BABCB|nr:variant erythrocyte surface antigen-1 family protein [Babesia caballi]